jgi:uncharacterized protein (DUF305 family)
LNILVLPVALVAGTLAVTACGGPADTAGSGTTSNPSMSGMHQPTAAADSSSPAGAHGDADVTFATGMIFHHAQAVQMADMALSQASSPDVKELAAAVKAAQEPEIERMGSCLTRWGQPVPETMGHTMMMSRGATDGTMGHMMSEQDMTTLSKMSGPAFDRAWLTAMTAHHQGAVMMAQTELKAGSDADAMQLARDIISSQGAEITRMQGMMKSLPQ